MVAMRFSLDFIFSRFFPFNSILKFQSIYQTCPTTLFLPYFVEQVHLYISESKLFVLLFWSLRNILCKLFTLTFEQNRWQKVSLFNSSPNLHSAYFLLVQSYYNTPYAYTILLSIFFCTSRYQISLGFTSNWFNLRGQISSASLGNKYTIPHISSKLILVLFSAFQLYSQFLFVF